MSPHWSASAAQRLYLSLLRPIRRPIARKQVRALFEAMLDRKPDNEEEQRYVEALLERTITCARIARDLAGQTLVATAYRTMLKREAEPSAYSFQAPTLASPGGWQVFLDGLLSSQEFAAQLERSFMLAVFTGLLGRSADDTALYAYQMALAHGDITREAVLREVIDSEEFRTKRADRGFYAPLVETAQQLAMLAIQDIGAVDESGRPLSSPGVRLQPGTDPLPQILAVRDLALLIADTREGRTPETARFGGTRAR